MQYGVKKASEHPFRLQINKQIAGDEHKNANIGMRHCDICFFNLLNTSIKMYSHLSKQGSSLPYHLSLIKARRMTPTNYLFSKLQYRYKYDSDLRLIVIIFIYHSFS